MIKVINTIFATQNNYWSIFHKVYTHLEEENNALAFNIWMDFNNLPEGDLIDEKNILDKWREKYSDRAVYRAMNVLGPKHFIWNDNGYKEFFADPDFLEEYLKATAKEIKITLT